jgi:hypothetical protein
MNTLILILDLGVFGKRRVKDVNIAKRGCLIYTTLHECNGHDRVHYHDLVSQHELGVSLRESNDTLEHSNGRSSGISVVGLSLQLIVP